VGDRDTDPVVNMGPDQVRAFLSQGTRTAKLATVAADGRPHVVPVWFVLDDDDLIFTTQETSKKAKSRRRDPRVACCIDDERALRVRDGVRHGHAQHQPRRSTPLGDPDRWALHG
jgi:PPOX class probable F420-dependent enzyme